MSLRPQKASRWFFCFPLVIRKGRYIYNAKVTLITFFSSSSSSSSPGSQTRSCNENCCRKFSHHSLPFGGYDVNSTFIGARRMAVTSNCVNEKEFFPVGTRRGDPNLSNSCRLIPVHCQMMAMEAVKEKFKCFLGIVQCTPNLLSK